MGRINAGAYDCVTGAILFSAELTEEGSFPEKRDCRAARGAVQR